VASITSDATGTTSQEPKNQFMIMPTVRIQTLSGNPRSALGPESKQEPNRKKKATCMMTLRFVFSQSQPPIVDPNPQEMPIDANSNPIPVSPMPIAPSLTESVGSINAQQIIPRMQAIKALKDLRFFKMSPYVTEIVLVEVF